MMINKYILFFVIFLLIIPGTFHPDLIFAQEGNPAQVAPVDFVLVLDNSKSMRTNDPEFMARRASQSFINGLRDETQAGLVVFDGSIKNVVSLQPFNAGGRGTLLAALESLTFDGSLTNTPMAMERAIYMLKTYGREESRKFIILITDGIVDLGDRNLAFEKTRWLREDLTREAIRSDIVIFGIAFSEHADFQLMQTLAYQTKGEYFRVFNSKDLQVVFHRIKNHFEKAPLANLAILSKKSPDPLKTDVKTQDAVVLESMAKSSVKKMPEVVTSHLVASVPTTPKDTSITTPFVTVPPIPRTLVQPHPNSSPINAPLAVSPVTNLPAETPSALVETGKVVKPMDSPPLSEGGYFANGKGAAPLPHVNVVPTATPTFKENQSQKVTNSPHSNGSLTMKGEHADENEVRNMNSLTGIQGSKSGELKVVWLRYFEISALLLLAFLSWHFGLGRKLLSWYNQKRGIKESQEGPRGKPLYPWEKNHLCSQDFTMQIPDLPPPRFHPPEDLPKPRTAEDEVKLDSIYFRGSKEDPVNILPPCALESINDPEVRHEIQKPITIIGRRDEFIPVQHGRIAIDMQDISRKHATIEFFDGVYWLKDLGSANGTCLNNRRIRQKVRLKHGDIVDICDTSWRFVLLNEKDRSNETLIFADIANSRDGKT